VTRLPGCASVPMYPKRFERAAPFEHQSRLRERDVVELVVGSLLFLPLIRVFLSILCAALGALWCLAISGCFCWVPGHNPSPDSGPRFAVKVKLALLKYPCQWLTRLWLLALGFWWVRVEGHRPCCPSAIAGDAAKVIVANHTTFIDVLVFVWLQMPSFLAKIGVFQVPLIGTVGRVNRMIGVERSSSTTRATTKEKVLAHIADQEAPPLLIFPEGTTTRNDSLIMFKAGGAFAAGVPVQPVALLYGQRCGSGFDLCNTPSTPTGMWILQLLCAPYHCLTVRYLQPVKPTQEFIDDPNAFAQNVQAKLAASLGPSVNVTQQSYEEFFLYKYGCEELHLPVIVLRTLDFKEAAAMIAAEGGKTLTLEDAKVSLLLFSLAFECERNATSPAAHSIQQKGITRVGIHEALTKHTTLPTDKDVEEVLQSMTSVNVPTAPDIQGLDFQQFLLVLHATMPDISVSEGWFADFRRANTKQSRARVQEGGEGQETNGGDGGGGASSSVGDGRMPGERESEEDKGDIEMAQDQGEVGLDITAPSSVLIGVQLGVGATLPPPANGGKKS